MMHLHILCKVKGNNVKYLQCHFYKKHILSSNNAGKAASWLLAISPKVSKPERQSYVQ